MMFRALFAFSVILSHALGASIYADDHSIDDKAPTVEIKNGKLIGRRFLTADGNDFPYTGFLGIPFAEPPIGPNRFQPPQRKKNWPGTLNATLDSPICMQPDSDNATTMSEDCLYLNVYTPDLSGSMPVMVWIYGGGFIFGSAVKTLYGPDYLIKENVVVVTINYRLGIFGFISTQDEVAPGNYGLKDQIMALRWVNENIREFGGNPENVTIFGESAGSSSVSLLLQAKTAKGLYHGAIMESGVSLSSFSRTRKPAEVAYSTAKLLGITANTSQELIAGLRNVTAEALLSASYTNYILTVAVTNPLDGLVFAPCIEPPHKDAVITEGSYEQLKRGDYNVVPVIVGFNSAEGNPFIPAVTEIPIFLLRYDLNHRMLVPMDMNANESLRGEIGNKIKTYYFGAKSIRSQKEALSKFITDDQFIRPTNKFVQLVSKFAPAFYYEFSYVGNETGSVRNLPGVGHAEEVSYLWNTGLTLAEDDLPTRRKLVKMWTNFAKFRNPTPATDADLDNEIWTSADSSPNLPYLQIKSKLRRGTNPREKDVSFWSSLYEQYGNAPYDTY